MGRLNSFGSWSKAAAAGALVMATHPGASSMEKREARSQGILARLQGIWSCGWPLVLLAGQNLLIFFKHYFFDHGFPGDFPRYYYGMTVFWTTLWSQGVFPNWIPFQDMGIPFDLVTQSGAHYPLLWIFPLLKIQYSLHAAVVFQCLHVLLGALGMYIFLKKALPQGRYAQLYAALGAFIFQFFGGFYSNAQHVDIIRAFALTPWLFLVFTLEETPPHIERKQLLAIPWIILLFATGAYPGNLISGALGMGCYLLFQIVRLRQKGAAMQSLLLLLLKVGGFTLLGAGLSVFHLGPVAYFGEYLTRSAQLSKLQVMALGFEQLPSLFMSNRLVPGEYSMTSFYMTLPALVLLTYLPLRWLKEKWPLAGVLLLSFSLVGGPASIIWSLLTRLLPLFRTSRYPSSDYRALLIIPLIFFAMLALRSLMEDGLPRGVFWLRTALACAWFMAGILAIYPGLRAAEAAIVALIFLAGPALLFIFIAGRDPLAIRKGLPGLSAAAVLLFLLTGLDGVRVLSDMARADPRDSWLVPGFSSYYQQKNWPLLRDGRLLTYDLIENAPASRPARVVKPDYLDYSWEGFITGRHVILERDLPGQLQAHAVVLDQSTYTKYMLREWLPVFLPPVEYPLEGDQFHLSVKKIDPGVSRSGESRAWVRQTHYGLDEVEYQVSLPHEVLMVENEVWFPGWTAELRSAHGTQMIRAAAAEGVFRAWFLPAGDYSMKAHFSLPGTALFRGISLAALGLWLVMLLGGPRRFRRQGLGRAVTTF